jgi:23S rRNA G2445 N2-methylase RlmL
MAQAFPASTFVGSDYHQGSIDAAREAAAAAGVAEHRRFEVATAQGYSGSGSTW